MSDHQRRFLCRTLFFFGCLLPTSLTVYWICHPQTAEGWERTISAALGVETTIGDVETPGPFTTVLYDVEFKYAGEVLFQTTEVQLSFDSHRTHVLIDTPVKAIDNLGLAYLAGRINQHVIRGRGAEQICRIEFGENARVQVHRSDFDPDVVEQGVSLAMLQERRKKQLSLRNLRIDLAPTAEGTACTVYFNARDRTGRWSDPILLDMDTDSRGQSVRLDTQSGALPLWMLAGFEPQIASSMGEDATFTGKLEWEPSAGRLASLVGLFDHIDLPGYAGQDLGYGEQARIDVKACEFRDGQFVRWAAELSSPTLVPTPIHRDWLFTQSETIALRQAIQQTALESRRRVSNRPPERR